MDEHPGRIDTSMIGGDVVDSAGCTACRWPAVVPANLTASVGDGVYKLVQQGSVDLERPALGGAHFSAVGDFALAVQTRAATLPRATQKNPGGFLPGHHALAVASVRSFTCCFRRRGWQLRLQHHRQPAATHRQPFGFTGKLVLLELE